MKEETRCRKAPGQTSCTATHTDAESLACVVLFQKLLWMMMLCCILYLQTATKGLWLTIFYAAASSVAHQWAQWSKPEEERRKMRPEWRQRCNLNSVPDAPQVSGDRSLSCEASGALHWARSKPDVTEGKPANIESSTWMQRDPITAHKSRENSTKTSTTLALIQAMQGPAVRGGYWQAALLSVHPQLISLSREQPLEHSKPSIHPELRSGTWNKGTLPTAPAQLTPNFPWQNWIGKICILSQQQVWPLH